MKNLKLHLDLLETQLATLKEEEDSPRGKLFQTKFQISKVKNLSDNPETLVSEILATKKALAERRIHYATQVVQRALKPWVKMEALRIDKRGKREPERAPKLGAEKQLLLSWDVQIVSEDFVLRQVAKKSPGIVESPKSGLNNAESNLYGRFGKVPAIRDAVKSLLEVLSRWFEVEGAKENKKVETEVRTKPGSAGKAAKSESSNQHNLAAGSAGYLGGDGQHEERSNEAEFDTDDSEKVVEVSADPANPQSSLDLDISDSEDDFFETGEGAGGPSNLPALAQGYISGSEDEDDAIALDPEPKRRNRRGQRARRRIWELKYGKRANHVLKQEHEHEIKQAAKDERRKARESRNKQLALRASEKKKADAGPLHPSWEAKRREATKQAAVFAGSKRKFED